MKAKKQTLILLCFSLFPAFVTFGQTTGRIDSLKDAWETSVSYVGEIKDGKPNGLGMFLYQNDFALRYVGYFVGGMPTGKGTLIFKDGYFLTGNWKNGKLEGRGANLTKDKDLYVGDFVNGKKEGNATYIYADNGFLIGKMKNDKYEGRCIFVGKNAETIADNIYIDGKKNGSGYQFEISNKKLFKGNWKDGNWVSATESSYTTFLTDSRFYSEKTDNQIIMGNLDSKKNLQDSAFFLNKKTNKRFFGKYEAGKLTNGLIIRDDSTRFIGALDDIGAYGPCSFLKMNEYYDEGNYVNDYLNGPNNLSINIKKKTVYYGSVINKGEFTGKAWFANNKNALYNGEYLVGKFTGKGYYINEDGVCIKGQWTDGEPDVITSIVSPKGKTYNPKPSALAEGLSILDLMRSDFYDKILKDDVDEAFFTTEFLAAYDSKITMPKSVQNLVLTDFDDNYSFVSVMSKSAEFDEAAKAYETLCKELQTVKFIPAKGLKPVGLKVYDEQSVKVNKSEKPKKQMATFGITGEPKISSAYFTVHALLKWNDEAEQYYIMLLAGDKDTANLLLDSEL